MARRVHSLADLPPETRLIAEELTAGESRTSQMCPACNGGRTGEGSLGVRHEGARIVLRCWRAGCGYYAQIPTGADFVFRPPGFKPRPYDDILLPLPAGMKRGLTMRWGLAEETMRRAGLMHAAEEGEPSIWMPVYCPLGHERGGLIRRLDRKAQPKVLTYKCTDEPFIGWYLGRDGAPLIIVEDLISAMRAWQAGYNAVALLGTHLSRAMAAELVDVWRWEPIGLALDKDAFSVACRICAKYGDRLNIRPILLAADLKDLPDDAAVRARITGA